MSGHSINFSNPNYKQGFITSDSGNYSTFSGTEVVPTSLSDSVKTDGEYVLIKCFGAKDASNEAYFGEASGTASIKIYRDSTIIVHYKLGAGEKIPPSAIGALDLPSAGSHTYEVRVSTTGTISVQSVKLGVVVL